MKIGNISRGCLIGLVLCGGYTAFGQSVSANVSATVSEEVDNGAVSASINPMVVAGGKGGGADNHGSVLGLSTGAAGKRGTGEQAAGILAGRNSADTESNESDISSFTLDRFQLSAPTASQKNTLRRLSTSTAHQVSAFDYGSKSRSAASAIMYKKSADGSGGLQGGQTESSYQTTAAYSTGFQDSTKGTGLLSPPDPGTTGPLDWAPGELDYELPDLLQTQFLNPTLNSGIGRRKGAHGRRGGMHAGAKKMRSDHMPSALQPSLSDQILNPAILNQTKPQSPLDQILNPQLDQPLAPQ